MTLPIAWWGFRARLEGVYNTTPHWLWVTGYVKGVGTTPSRLERGEDDFVRARNVFAKSYRWMTNGHHGEIA